MNTSLKNLILTSFIFIFISVLIIYGMSFFYIKDNEDNIKILVLIYIYLASGLIPFSKELSRKILRYNYINNDGKTADMGNFPVIFIKFFMYLILPPTLFIIMVVGFSPFVIIILAMTMFEAYKDFFLILTIIIFITLIIIMLVYTTFAVGIFKKILYYLHVDLTGNLLYQQNKGNALVYTKYTPDTLISPYEEEGFFILDKDIFNLKNEIRIESNLKQKQNIVTNETLTELNEEEKYLKEKLEKKRSINALKAKIQAQDDMQKVNDAVEKELKNRKRY